MMARKLIPPVTVSLGRTLELVTLEGDNVTRWDEVAGWHLLTTADAFDREAGYASLFIVPGEFRTEDYGDPDDFGGDETAYARAYRRWHQRDFDMIGMLKIPDSAGTKIGRALRLDYASDKWNRRGAVIEYTHDFTEGDALPPVAYVRNRKDPKAFVLTGGHMTITERGIT